MQYQKIDGIKCFAPELAFQNNGLPAEAFERVFNAETTHFWFCSRNRLLQFLVGRFLGHQPKRFLEIGCGTGAVLTNLHYFYPSLQLTGAEIYLSGLKLAQKRLPQAEFVQLDATRMPFLDEFDAIGLFDVLEHVEPDELVLHNAYIALKDEGILFVSVPQHPFLWSANDRASFHKRRYRRSELLTKMNRVGFQPIFISSFVTLLFPLLFTIRLIKRRSRFENPFDAVMAELSLTPSLNATANAIMKVEELIIRAGIPLPFGGSLFLVAKKSPK